MPRLADAAAEAAIGAAAASCTCPPSAPKPSALAEIAARERLTHRRFLAEVLTAEVDDRDERRRARRINEAKFPRAKRLADFDIDAVPGIAPATLGHLAGGAYIDAGEPVVLLGDSGTGKTHLLIGAGPGRLRTGPPGPLRHHRRNWSTNSSKPPTTRSSPASSAATAAWTCSASTSSATSTSTPAAPNCCSRSSPNEKNEPPSHRHQRCRSANGAHVFPDPRLVAAIVDRVTFNAHIIETGTTVLPAHQHTSQEGSHQHLTDPRVGPNQASTVGPNQLVILTERRTRVGDAATHRSVPARRKHSLIPLSRQCSSQY